MNEKPPYPSVAAALSAGLNLAAQALPTLAEASAAMIEVGRAMTPPAADSPAPVLGVAEICEAFGVPPPVAVPDLLRRVAAIGEARERGYAERRHGGVVNGECADALAALLPEIQAAEQLQRGTRGDQYRAELYDEVWQQARAMGYANVTEALAALAAATQPAFVVVAGRWDDGASNTKFISEPLTLDAALASYAECSGYTWRQIEYKGLALEVVCDG